MVKLFLAPEYHIFAYGESKIQAPRIITTATFDPQDLAKTIESLEFCRLADPNDTRSELITDSDLTEKVRRELVSSLPDWAAIGDRDPSRYDKLFQKIVEGPSVQYAESDGVTPSDMRDDEYVWGSRAVRAIAYRFGFSYDEMPLLLNDSGLKPHTTKKQPFRKTSLYLLHNVVEIIRSKNTNR